MWHLVWLSMDVYRNSFRGKVKVFMGGVVGGKSFKLLAKCKRMQVPKTKKLLIIYLKMLRLSLLISYPFIVKNENEK